MFYLYVESTPASLLILTWSNMQINPLSSRQKRGNRLNLILIDGSAAAAKEN